MLAGVRAVAGPPFVTHDPEPVDLGHFEINTAAQGTDVAGARGGASPSLDIKDGPRFHIGPSVPYQATNGQNTQFGYGDTEFGLKYRFIT
jgi:hypothetical protein